MVKMSVTVTSSFRVLEYWTPGKQGKNASVLSGLLLMRRIVISELLFYNPCSISTLVTIIITLQFCDFNLSMTKACSGDQFVIIKTMLWPAAKGTGTNAECDFYLFS